MRNSLTVVGAYGRDYKNKQAVIEDWEKDRDFLIKGPLERSGSYINKSDAVLYGVTHVYVRYSNLKKVLEIVVDGKGRFR